MKITVWKPEDVMAYFRISKRTLKRWLKQEKLPYIKIDSTIRFIKEKVIKKYL